MPYLPLTTTEIDFASVRVSQYDGGVKISSMHITEGYAIPYVIDIWLSVDPMFEEVLTLPAH